MAVYYKFKSAKDYDSIPIDGHFISVANLKEKIFESKHLGRGTDFDLVVTNAQTNEEYLDEAMLIPKNTSVLIRRVPGRPRMNIVTEPVIEQDEPKLEINKSDDAQPLNNSFLGADSSVTKYPEDSEWDEFGNDLYAIPEVLPVQASNPIQDAPPSSKADEDSKIKALIDTPALDWQRQTSDGFGPGRGFGRGMGGRMMGGRGFGRGGGGLERKNPPQGYICHRCKVPGHFIQHCPTNGDPNFDIKRVKPPTGIPKSMLMATPDGSYALPSGAVAVLKPNEAAFEREIEGLPSTRSVGDLPPELHCPLCKDVMKDAVLTSKCCFKSFCDKCIRDHIISKSMCVCGATNILADDLLPNKTLRDTINRILESNNSSAENGGSAFQAQDMESKIPQPKMEPKVPSPTQSAASKGEQLPPPQYTHSAVSKGEQLPPPQNEEISKVRDAADQGTILSAPQKTLEKGRTGKVPNASEATHDSMSMKEPASQGSALLADEEVQQKLVSGEAGKKKKKKKPRLPLNAAEMQWKMSQDLAAENYMMPMGPAAYNPYWTGMQPGMEGYGAPYGGAPFGGSLPFMGYGLGPLDVPFGVLPQDPFGAQGYHMMPPIPPQRDLADFGMGFNPGPPIMSREEFEARKADLRRKHEMERRGERELSKDREFSREVSSSGDVSSLKSKSKSVPQPSSGEHHSHRQRSERSVPERPVRDRDPELPRPSSKRKSDYDYDYDHRDRDRDRDDHHHSHSSHHHRSESSSAARSSSATLEPPPPLPQSKSTTTDRKQKPSVFSRISFPAEEPPATSKKRKLSSSEAAAGGSASSAAQHSHRSSANGYHEDYKTSSSSLKAVSVSRKSAAASASASASAAVAGVDYESSDDDRHFKRRPSRYESPPAVVAAAEWEEEGRHSRGGGGGGGGGKRERGRDERERGGYSKHR
ncbi:E3 ubiquitin ligase PARAQUAT TOLERANCE 3-like isoform X2 [Camellia sinensis]|uniref:E3 ubiquitin ligase PARAQUAT TOLERANCE 3-like isoform X2 n=1 Tax=Camellia sinensis TaxID=4442 RepID=UPI001036A537|nr:E3 ubiquitin ligase PARAQUAT TOLERANCE 3-like isoform X2 [Camellia sinensis]